MMCERYQQLDVQNVQRGVRSERGVQHDFEFRSFYLCGRKIVDLQFKSANGRLAEDEGFVAALHLNHTEARKF